MVDRLIGSVSNQALLAAVVVPLVSAVILVLASPALHTNGKLLVAASLVLSLGAFGVTRRVIPLAGEKLKPKLNGVDLGKLPRQPPIPQSLGLISGTSFLTLLVLLQCVADGGLKPKYDSLMLSVCFSVLLGLADDVMDIRWSHKILVGLLAAVPLLTKYDGPTSILVPSGLRPVVQSGPVQAVLQVLQVASSSPDGVVLELGVFYLVYVVALVVFSTNAINIYAGINGIEVGQSVVIGSGMAVVDCLELFGSDPESSNSQNHLFSLTVMLPFVFTSLALLTENWFPARVFIGDVYPYYAGMTFAATAVLGHYSRTLLLLLIPQVANYLYSMPQLFGAVPCPRHRLPRVNPETKLLEPSTVSPDSEVANMTLLCLALRVFGPMRERSLTVLLLVVQVACTLVFGVVGRFVLARVLF